MIENDKQLNHTLTLIETFDKLLAALEQSRSHYHPSWYEIIIQGPKEERAKLQAEVDKYRETLIK